MDVSLVNLVSAEPSAPAKPDKGGHDAQQFDQLLAAGAQAERAKPSPAPAPAPKPRGEAPAAPSRKPAQARPETDADDRAQRTSATDDADAAPSDEPTTEQAAADQAEDQPATGTPKETKGKDTAQASDKTAGDADEAPADDEGVVVAAEVLAIVAPVVSTAPTPGAAAEALAEGPALPTQAPATLPAPPTPAAPAPDAAKPAPTTAAAPAAPDLTALATAITQASTALASAGKQASPDPAPSLATGKTAAEALAQLNSNAAVKVTPAPGGDDAGQAALRNMPQGAQQAAEAPATGGKAGAVSSDTLLFSQLADDAELPEAAMARAPAPTGNSPLGATGTTATAAAATPTSAPAPARPAPLLLPLLDQVLPQISQAVHNGQGTGGRFTIQLRPSELGRVHVDLKIADDGRVSASIVADRADTLALLRRDSHLLEQALTDAGLSTSNGDLQFSLSGDSRGTGFDEPNGSSRNAGATAIGVVEDPDAAAPVQRIGGLTLVDVHV